MYRAKQTRLQVWYVALCWQTVFFHRRFILRTLKRWIPNGQSWQTTKYCGNCKWASDLWTRYVSMLLLIELADWMEIPSNTIVCITPNMNVLSYPILDEYHNDSYGTLSRNPDFAMRAGFHPSVVLHNPDSSVGAPNRIECWNDCSTKQFRVEEMCQIFVAHRLTIDTTTMHPALIIFLVSLLNHVITWFGRDTLQEIVRLKSCT